MKLFYYSRHLLLNCLPDFYFQRKKKALEKKYTHFEDIVSKRVGYYCNVSKPTDVSLDAQNRETNYRFRGKSCYFFDLKEYLYFFSKQLKFDYHFGDEVESHSPTPKILKARHIEQDNGNTVLLKLNRCRHFKFVKDKRTFRSKLDKAVFRGLVVKDHRIRFMETMYGSNYVDAGKTNTSLGKPEWVKPFMTIEEQLKYKFIISLEGNDVASNLKWAMSSNSLVISPKMRFETWFMEGSLIPNVHYVEVKDDWSDCEEKMQYYIEHPEEAEKIIRNAHEHIAQFKDKDLEAYINIKTLEKYFQVTQQL